MSTGKLPAVQPCNTLRPRITPMQWHNNIRHCCSTPESNDLPSARCRLATNPTDRAAHPPTVRHMPQAATSTCTLTDATAASRDLSLLAQGLLRAVRSCADTFSGSTVSSGSTADDWMRGLWVGDSLSSRHNEPALMGLVVFLVAWLHVTGVVVPHAVRVGSPLSL